LVFELEPMYATSDRQTDDGRRSPLNAPPLRGGGIIRLGPTERHVNVKNTTSDAPPKHAVTAPQSMHLKYLAHVGLFKILLPPYRVGYSTLHSVSSLSVLCFKQLRKL